MGKKKKVNKGKAGRREQEIEEDYDYGENMELTSMLSGAPPEMAEFDQNDQHDQHDDGFFTFPFSSIIYFFSFRCFLCFRIIKKYVCVTAASFMSYTFPYVL